MRRFTVIAALVAALALGACGGEEEAPFVPERVTNEQALRLLRSCDVTGLLAAHSGEVRLTLEGGRTIVIRPHTTALSKAAVNASLERGCKIAVGME